MLSRHSSRRASLYEEFLKPRLTGATRYDRIAGYFQSSLLELASESLAAITRIRIVCNTEVNAEDVKTVRMAVGARRKELEDGLSARWDSGGWMTERDEFHPALPGKVTNCPRKIGIVSTSVVTSAPLSERNRILVEQLLEKRFACVIWDEAHRIRRGNLSANNVFAPPEKKRLYRFAEQLAGRCKTLLLATATPVQLHSMELWDLLYILAVNNPQVLGSSNSLWRKVDGPDLFDIVAGRQEVETFYAKW